MNTLVKAATHDFVLNLKRDELCVCACVCLWGQKRWPKKGVKKP